MKQRAVFLFFLIFHLGAVANEIIPKELTGEWALEQTRFINGWPVEGDAFYIRSDGALVACTPAFGHNDTISRYRVVYNSRTKALSARTYYLGNETILWTMSYDPVSKTLASRKPFPVVIYSRVSGRIPLYFKASLR
ncbi:MAG: hypothetical protein QOE70_918 [Chthoniobacter sp.]|jgi:hypothetical protein|nr:hypothetical protein [Chthoniobacter sp.]